MATATTLTQAANQANNNLFTKWLADTLKASTASFATQVLALFDQQDPNTHPATNWAVLIAGLSEIMSEISVPPIPTVPIAQFQLAVQYVYRICLMVNQLETQTLITPTDGAAVLAIYNGAF